MILLGEKYWKFLFLIVKYIILFKYFDFNEGKWYFLRVKSYIYKD